MKSITLTLMLAFSLSVFSQQTTPPTVNTDHLKKSKNQKTIAWVLAGGGAVVWLVGVSKYMNQDNNEGGTKGKPAMLIGGVSVLASIPFFKASSKNKRRANSVGFKMERLPVIQQKNLVTHSYPALSFKISI